MDLSTFTASLAGRHAHLIESCQLNVFENAKLSSVDPCGPKESTLSPKEQKNRVRRYLVC